MNNKSSKYFIFFHVLFSFTHTHTHTHTIGLVSRVFPNGPGDTGSIPGRVISKTLKMVLDNSLLKTRQYKVHKWSNPGKGEAPSPAPWCSSYWKGSFLVTLDYGRQLYYLQWKEYNKKKEARMNLKAVRMISTKYVYISYIFNIYV